jgi:hypothetical protein
MACASASVESLAMTFWILADQDVEMPLIIVMLASIERLSGAMLAKEVSEKKVGSVGS